MTNEINPQLEDMLVQIVAVDRVYKPIASIDGKLKRKREKLVKGFPMESGENYKGERVYARVEEDETMKARGMAEAVTEFSEKFPQYGKILQGMIAEQRVVREKNLVFRMQEGKIIPAKDYIGVLLDLGFTQTTAENLYPELIDISRKLARKREEVERVIMIGQSYDSRNKK